MFVFVSGVREVEGQFTMAGCMCSCDGMSLFPGVVRQQAEGIVLGG